jgi:hypothetical protein
MDDNGIVRVRHDPNHPSTVIANDLLQNASLSFAARGLMGYLLSKPDNWQMRMTDLVAASPAGREATQAIIKELIAAGYIERSTEPVNGQHGQFCYVTIVHESPVAGHGEAVNGSTVNGFTVNGEAVHIISNELQSNECFLPPDAAEKPTRRKRAAPPSSPAGEPDAPEIPLHKEYFGVVCEICQMNGSLNKGRVARVAKQLREAGIPLDVLRRVYAPGGWWWVNDWRGQRKQPPTPEAVLETIESARLAQAPPKRPIERSADGVIIMPVGGSRNG